MTRFTDVSPQEHDAERVSVFVDGSFAFGCQAIVWLASGLRIGDEVTQERLDALRADDGIQAIKDRALRLLAARPRSRAELERKLAHPGPKRVAPDPALVRAALDRLVELGYLDDAAFAAFWVEQRDRFRPKGAAALRAELRERGVDRDAIDATIAPENDLDRAVDAARVRAERFAARPGVDFRAFRDQLGPFLARRGFSYDIARQAVVALWETLGGAAGDREPDDA